MLYLICLKPDNNIKVDQNRPKFLFGFSAYFGIPRRQAEVFLVYFGVTQCQAKVSDLFWHCLY